MNTTTDEKPGAKSSPGRLLLQHLAFLQEARELGTIDSWAIGESDPVEDDNTDHEGACILHVHGVEHRFSGDAVVDATAAAVAFLSQAPAETAPATDDALNTTAGGTNG
jgi:hypothetical protein